MKAVADTLGVARSNLVEQLRHPDRLRREPYTRAEDNEVIAEIRTITDARPTYGYRRVTALLNRARRGVGRPRLNHKRVFRLMRIACLLLQPCTGRRAMSRKVNNYKVVGTGCVRQERIAEHVHDVYFGCVFIQEYLYVILSEAPTFFISEKVREVFCVFG